jgi:hypothetical protein
LNGSVALQKGASSTIIKYVGHLSVLAATVLGIYIAKTRDAPVFAGVISWALFAVADGMKTRLAAAAAAAAAIDGKKKQKDKDVIGLNGAKTQYILSTAGAMLNGLAVAFVTGTMSASSKSVPTP